MFCTMSLQLVSASSELPAVICGTNCTELGQTSQVRSTVLHKTSLTQTPAASLGSLRPPSLLISWLKTYRVPTSPLKFNNSLNDSQDSEKRYTYNYNFMTAKGYKSEVAKARDG